MADDPTLQREAIERGEPDGVLSSDELADAEGKGTMPAQQPRQGGSPESEGKSLADAEDDNRRREPETGGRNGVGLAGDDYGLDDSDGPRLQDGRTKSAGELPAFPPGPDGLDEWRTIFEKFPQATPAPSAFDLALRRNFVGILNRAFKGEILEETPESLIRKLAYGLAARYELDRNRIDRLRALGNGVVPLQAAYAFLTLLSAIK